MSEAKALITLPPRMVGEVLAAKARHETGERRTRLLDMATATHPGENGKNLMKLSKALEKASKPPPPKRSAQEQADADAAAAIAHLMG